MHSLWSGAALVVAVLARSTAADVTYNATTYVGCYSAAGALTSSDTYTWQSSGHCQAQCIPSSDRDAQAVMGLNKGSDCWCGDTLPPESDKVDDDQCNAPCTGFDKVMCGGKDTFSVYLTGLDDNVSTSEDSKDSGDSQAGASDSGSTDTGSPSPSDQAAPTTVFQEPSVITEAGRTIVVTTAPDRAGATGTLTDPASSAQGGSGGSPNKVGIAVGIVVGVIALAALIGAAVFFVRRRKRKAVEEDYRRNQAIGSFGNHDKSHSKTASISDQRLDPSLLHKRRQSDGSIADEMDFSRRILQVRNPDGV